MPFGELRVGDLTACEAKIADDIVLQDVMQEPADVDIGRLSSRP